MCSKDLFRAFPRANAYTMERPEVTVSCVQSGYGLLLFRLNNNFNYPKSFNYVDFQIMDLGNKKQYH